jgi:predicted dehydrogenase
MGDQQVRIGVIGVGGMGKSHANHIKDGKVPGAILGAVCDQSEHALTPFDGTPAFTDAEEMVGSGTVDAVIVATPHYSHTSLSEIILAAGLHLLVEKPLGVTTADCRRTIAAYESRPNPDQVFAVMFNQRTNPLYIKLKQLIDNGEIGAIKRVQWTITDWFRTEIYYRSGGWRATWKGEGGGVLVNQSPHQLDLFQWLFGMPTSIRAFARFGAYHDIEVEDDVTAFCTYENGATGTFITATGEYPGSNRLEVHGERGKIVVDRSHGSHEPFRFIRTEVGVSDHSATTDSRFGGPDTWDCTINAENGGEQHVGIMKNFTNAILSGEQLMASGPEGINGVMLANAMLLSAWTGETIDLPIDDQRYVDALQERIDNSTFVKKETVSTNNDLGGSF